MSPGAGSLLCVRSEALSASRASPLLRAGIARLRRSAALLVASSFMIGASIQGYLAIGIGVNVILTSCPKRDLPTEGKNWPSPAV